MKGYPEKAIKGWPYLEARKTVDQGSGTPSSRDCRSEDLRIQRSPRPLGCPQGATRTLVLPGTKRTNDISLGTCDVFATDCCRFVEDFGLTAAK